MRYLNGLRKSPDRHHCESKNHLPGYVLRAGGSPEREYDKYTDTVTEDDGNR